MGKNLFYLGKAEAAFINKSLQQSILVCTSHEDCLPESWDLLGIQEPKHPQRVSCLCITTPSRCCLLLYALPWVAARVQGRKNVHPYLACTRATSPPLTWTSIMVKGYPRRMKRSNRLSSSPSSLALYERIVGGSWRWSPTRTSR